MMEIAYIIDEKESHISQMLVIRLARLDKTHPLAPLQELESPSTGSSLKQLGTPKDKEIILHLIKEEVDFLRQKSGVTPSIDTTLFKHFHIANARSISSLKVLSASNKLYFNNKQLVCDFFGKVDFYYQLELLTENRLRVSGRLKWRDTDIDIQECQWVGAGKPHWFIKGLSLKLISTDISAKRLLQTYRQDPLILSSLEKTAFLEELDPEDPEAAQAIFVGGTESDVKKMPDPLPLLILKDRSGAFADLQMDYGHGYQIDYHSHIKDFKNTKGAIIARRMPEAEKNWEKDLLETDFIKKDVGSSRYYCPLDKVAKSLTFLLELGWTIHDMKKQRIIRQDSNNLTIEQTSQVFRVKGKVRYEDCDTDVTDVIGAFNRRERFIQLNANTVGLIPYQWTQTELQELAEEGEIVGDSIQIKKNRIGNLQTLLKGSSIQPSLIGLREKIQNFSSIEHVEPGIAFKGELRPYQQEGLNWLSFLVEYGFHGILADDMGLGKTIQALALLSRIQTPLPHLIVVPTSLLFNWKNEIEKFLPGSHPYIHQGAKRAKTTKELSHFPIILTSYTTLRLDLLLFQNLSYHTIILDEAQNIKNAHTQTAQAVCSLSSEFRLSITGTPIENHLNELWSHFHFLIPDLFDEEKKFEADLLAAQSDSRYLQRIKKKIAPFILRRKKEEVAKDLPERIDQIVWIDIPDEQRRIYDQFLSGIKTGLLKKVQLEGISKHRMEVFEAILRLRQICCHPLLVSVDEPASPSAKFEALLEDLETAIEEKRKVLVYSQFTSMLQLMTRAARERNWNYVYLDGQTVNREKVVDSFQNDPSIPIFFISLKAGGVGLNLTAADYVFLYDPWWNEAVENQAINRAHRLGRKETVIAKRFVMVESIEEKMMKLKSLKKRNIDEILDESLENLNLTNEDLIYLIDNQS